MEKIDELILVLKDIADSLRKIAEREGEDEAVDIFDGFSSF